MVSNYKQHGGNGARTGLTLIELTVAVAVFSVLLATTMKMITLASNQVRKNERRLVAHQAVQAISEQTENIPWDNLSTETANQIGLPDAAIARLPDAELTVAVSDETDPVSKRIAVELTWKGSGAGRDGPVRLITWAFPDSPQPRP